MPLEKEEELELIDVDLDRLEHQWCDQPTQHYKLCVDLAEARAEERRAKAEFEVIEAETEQQIRLHPEVHGIRRTKPTERDFEIALILHQRVKKARERHIKAQYDVDVCQAAVSASEHRKKALESNTSLLIGGFYSRPKLKGDMQEKLNDYREREHHIGGKKRRGE